MDEWVGDNMSKEVIVTVKSKQLMKGEEEVIELVTPGKFYKKESAYYIVYDETEISGMKGTTTTVKIEDESVSLIRFGTTSTNLRFIEGVKSISLYKTPYGILELTVMPLLVEMNVDDGGGDIKLHYELDAGGQQSSMNELLIKIQ